MHCTQLEAQATQTQALQDLCDTARNEKNSVESQATIVATALADACAEIEALKSSLANAEQGNASKNAKIATLQQQLASTTESLTQQRVDVEMRLQQELLTAQAEKDRVAGVLSSQLTDTQRSLQRVQRREQGMPTHTFGCSAHVPHLWVAQHKGEGLC